MPAAYDWLVIGDVALARSDDRSASSALGGAAARLAAHGAARGLSTALVAKTGDDAAGRTVREILARYRVDLRFAPVAAGQRTAVWQDAPGRAQPGRLERGCDLLLRLDEIPPPSALRAALTLVSGYSLCVEPARAAALGALRDATARGGRSALLVEADLLWWTNARMARRVLEPAIAAAHGVGLSAADAAVLFGPKLTGAEAVRAIGRLGPALVYLATADGGVILLEQGRLHAVPPGRPGAPADRFAGPAAFFGRVLQGLPARRAAVAALEYAQSARRPGARRLPRASSHV